MKELLREKFKAHYYQIGLVDVEGPDAYPLWESGEESAVVGPKGIAVATPSDGYVETIILTGKGSVDGVELASCVIDVGHSGLWVGNETSASSKVFAWPVGKTLVTVYMVNEGQDAVKVIFCLALLS
jgi:hypothetical protein